ncbi:hypothetical protein [Streptomyces sp. SBT349]|uniref:hypothetical protein n=1 Tax=Streptomyces sp. SBT349 TaxID=1580539 RepID=UPI000AFE9253|nr:hypothetical protein [Streptomyces sp. SBT349]
MTERPAPTGPLPDADPDLCPWGEAGGGQPARACSLPAGHDGAPDTCRMDRLPTEETP